MFTSILLYFFPASFTIASTVHCTLQIDRDGCQDSCPSPCAAASLRRISGFDKTLPSCLPLSDDPIPVHTMEAKSSSPYKGKEGQPWGVAHSQVIF